MGTSVIPQGPNKHCGNVELHERHASVGEFVPVSASGRRVQVGQTWCDGIPPLEPFVELTVRVPLAHFMGSDPEARHHKVILGWLAEEGLGVIVDEMGERGSATVLRVRTGDGVDRVYPLIRKKGGPLLAVTDHDPS